MGIYRQKVGKVCSQGSIVSSLQQLWVVKMSIWIQARKLGFGWRLKLIWAYGCRDCWWNGRGSSGKLIGYLNYQVKIYSYPHSTWLPAFSFWFSYTINSSIPSSVFESLRSHSDQLVTTHTERSIQWDLPRTQLMVDIVFNSSWTLERTRAK